MAGEKGLYSGYRSDLSTAGSAEAPGVLPQPVSVPVVEKLSSTARLRALPVWLTWLALGLYTLTRLIALPSFPIYFFTDEAVQSVTAADLVNNHFYSPAHELLPTYFQNGSQYNLSVSVYLQIIPTLLLGKSIWVTRGTAALVTVLAALCAGWIAKRVFKSPYPWLAVLILSTTPAWFLHSRTAFETTLATSFFTVFLYFYLLYRTQNPRWLLAALAAAALAFYSYSGMRPVMAVLGLLLLVCDFNYHRRHWRMVLSGAGLGLLLMLPFLRFLINHPEASEWQMRLLGSYWLTSAPLPQKLGEFALQYLRGLNPWYWYVPNTLDLPRHIMLGYGHLLWWTLPLGSGGLVLALRNFRNPAYRTLLMAVLAAPAGAAMVQVGITRVLAMVAPMAVLTALGAQVALEWLHAHKAISRAALSLSVFGVLAVTNGYMLADALAHAPLWFHNYGLTGMQYGAQQVFGAVKDELKAHPGEHIVVSPTWANGTDVLARFFFADPLPFDLGSPDGAFQQVQPLENTLFVMVPDEFARIPPTRFAEVRVEKTLLYPDGQPGFYFVRLKYVDEIQQVIAREEAQRRQPVSETLVIDGQPARVTYPHLDIGQIQDIFSGSPDALIRSAAINPMRLAFDFSPPRVIRGIMLRVGGMAMDITVQAQAKGQAAPFKLSRSLPEAVELRDISFDFPAPVTLERLTVEIKNTNDPPDGHVHLWQLKLREQN